MDKIAEKLDPICNKLGLEKLDDNKILKPLAEKLKLKPHHLAFFVILIITLALLAGFA